MGDLGQLVPVVVLIVRGLAVGVRYRTEPPYGIVIHSGRMSEWIDDGLEIAVRVVSELGCSEEGGHGRGLTA